METREEQVLVYLVQVALTREVAKDKVDTLLHLVLGGVNGQLCVLRDLIRVRVACSTKRLLLGGTTRAHTHRSLHSPVNSEMVPSRALRYKPLTSRFMHTSKLVATCTNTKAPSVLTHTQT